MNLIQRFKHVEIYENSQRNAIEPENLPQPAVTFGM